MKRLICTLTLTMVFIVAVGAQQRSAPIQLNWDDAQNLVRQLAAAVDPARPENSYMPPLMREKLAWVFRENGAGRLTINLSKEPARNPDGSVNLGVLMDSTKYPASALINIYAGRLMTFVRWFQGVRYGYDDPTKDFFALGLVHEAIHLEQPVSFFARRSGPHPGPEEEERAWRKLIIQAARPMRESGRKMQSDIQEADDILRRCNDAPKCPDFIKFITTGKPGR